MKNFEKEINRYLDGDMSEAEALQFFRRAGADKEKADAFVKAGIQHQLLKELFEESDREETIQISSRVTNRKIPYLWLAAAVIVILAAILPFLLRKSEEPFAEIAQSVGAHWKGGQVVRLGEAIKPHRYRLEQGLVRVDFLHGATMTVQGPADFEVEDSMHVSFITGIATFQVPEPAIGFRVTTATANIVDLGTSFGIACDGNEGTGVSVFDGEVAVSQSNSAETVVRQGESVRAGEKIIPVTYDTASFERAWPLNSGVLQTTGLVKFVSPGPGFTPGAFEDSEHITVFLERSKAKVPKGLMVDFIDPGEYRKVRRGEGKPLPPVRRVRSYLLQLDPVGALEKHTPGKVRVRGQITFDSPIVGVIASHNRLRASDSAFGHPEGIYQETPRGVEPPKGRQPDDTGRDSVILAADQRTLIIDFAAGSAVDQLRVLVKHPTKGEKTN